MGATLGRTLLLTGAIAFAVAPAHAQGRPVIEIPYSGIQVFANLLHENGLAPIASIDELTLEKAPKTLIVVLGRTEAIVAIQQKIGDLPTFLRNGGALLVASDYPDRGRLRSLGVGIPGNPVDQARESAFLTYANCPVLARPDSLRNHPVYRNVVNPFVTMRPSLIQPFNPAVPLQRLLDYPDDCAVRGPLFRPPFPDRPERVAGIAGSPAGAPGGRALIIAGHGLFMNCFMVQQNYDNFQLAKNVVSWLAEGPNGRRTHVLLLEQGAAVRRLDLPLTQPEIPWAALINTFLDQVQRQGLVEDTLRRNVEPAAIWRIILIGLGALLVPLGLRRLVQSRFRRDVRAALVVGLQAADPSPLPLAQQRHSELARRGNLAEPARALVGRWLSEQGERGEELAAAFGAAPTIGGAESSARLEINASWWRRRTLRKNLAWVAALAGPAPVGPVSRRQFRRLALVLADLDQALRGGEIAFVSAGQSSKKDG